jgi:hypothetical protein
LAQRCIPAHAGPHVFVGLLPLMETQMKTEPRIAPPTARLILREKCASIVLTRWPFVRLNNNARKMPNSATMRRNAMRAMCCWDIPGKRKLEWATVPR